jgi:chromosome segregation ATPase
MLEEILGNTAFTPLAAALLAGASVFCIAVGWLARSVGTKRREEEHRRDVLEAKRSIPQLESAVRKAQQEVARLQLEVNDLSDSNSELTASAAAKDQALRASVREAKNLRSELDAVKGTSSESNNVIMDGFEDERGATDGDSKLQAKLDKTQALYDKLKQGLLQRDERIEALQSQLDGASNGAASSEPQVSIAEAQFPAGAETTTETVAALEATIDRLQQQLQESQRERDMLADMAKSRSENNHALKEASAAAEAQLPKLEQDIAQRDQTISDREASIKRLLNDLEESTGARDRFEAETLELATSLADRDAAVAEYEAKITTLQFTLDQRDERLTILSHELDNLRQENSACHATIAAHDSIVDAHVAELNSQQTDLTRQLSRLRRETEDLQASLQQREKWIAKLKGSLGEREVQNTTLEKRALKAERALEAERASTALQAEIDRLHQQPAPGPATAPGDKKLERKLALAESEASRAASQLKELEQSLTIYKQFVTDEQVDLTLPQAMQADTDLPKVIPLQRTGRRRAFRPQALRRGKRTSATTLAFRPRRQVKKRR